MANAPTSAKAPSKAVAIASCKCPRCRKGKLFMRPAWDLNRFIEMPERCPHCGFKYEIEPGFFWGAMYITYAFNVGMFLIAGALLWNVFGNPPTWVYVVTLGSLTVLAIPLQLRYSRTLMLHLFGQIDFDPNLYHQGPSLAGATDAEAHKLSGSGAQSAGSV